MLCIFEVLDLRRNAVLTSFRMCSWVRARVWRCQSPGLGSHAYLFELDHSPLGLYNAAYTIPPPPPFLLALHLIFRKKHLEIKDLKITNKLYTARLVKKSFVFFDVNACCSVQFVLNCVWFDLVVVRAVAACSDGLVYSGLFSLLARFCVCGASNAFSW